MSKREHRQFAAEQEPEILWEADQPSVSVSEVCHPHAAPKARGVAKKGVALPSATPTDTTTERLPLLARCPPPAASYG